MAIRKACGHDWDEDDNIYITIPATIQGHPDMDNPEVFCHTWDEVDYSFDEYDKHETAVDCHECFRERLAQDAKKTSGWDRMTKALDENGNPFIFKQWREDY